MRASHSVMLLNFIKNYFKYIFSNHIYILFLVFKGISIPSSIVAVSIYIPTNSARAFPFLHTVSSIYCL